MSSVQERLVALVSSKPEARRDVDIELALPWLRKKSELLQSLEKDTLKDVVRNCGYQKAKKDDVIIQQGDSGNCFYIMLTGRTSVYIDTIRTDEEVPPEPATPSKENKHAPVKRSTSSASIEKKADHSNHAIANEKKETNANEDKKDKKDKKGSLDRSVFGKFIMCFEAGQSFGEIALIRDNCVRNATIVSDVVTDLLIIHRDLFNSYIRASQVQEYEERQQFVQRCSLFHGWNAKFRSLLEMSLRKEVHPFGSVIVQQGAPVTGLVFILKGQAKIAMDPSRHLQQYKQLMSKSRSAVPASQKKHDAGGGEGGKAHHHVRSKTPVISAQIGVRRKLGYAAAERRLMTKTIDICCIEKDEIIGDVEMVLDLETNTETVISTATTTVLVLNTKNYERLVTKKHPFTVTRLTQWAYNKVSTRSRSSKGMCVQLFQDLEKELQERLPRPAPSAKRVEILKEQEVIMNQLVDLFVQGKAPLIQPCVPNSLFYKQRSAQKNKILMENPYAQLRTLKHIDTFGRIRRKFPRSIQQLKNNIEAERELLKDDRREVVESQDGKFLSSSLHHSRSRSAVTGSMLRITECGPEEDRFGVTSAQLDSSDRLDRRAVVEIYQELEQVNRETQEMRMRLICSASAKHEKRQAAKARTPRGRAKSAAAQLVEQTIEVDHARHRYHSVDDDELDQAGSDNDCFDWETSETNLRDLESRVASFCRSVTPSRGHLASRPASAVVATSLPASRPASGQVSDGLVITEMRRFEIDDPASVPLPGGVVYVHKKPCKFPGVVCSNPAVHKHVRRFILSKEPRAAWRGVAP
ncbi:hypothetical protein EGW08_002706, partial [Elysia chlorotica]